MERFQKFLSFISSGVSIGVGILVVALFLGFTPVENENFSDPCGSVFLPDRTYFSEKGEIVNKLTPPCRDVYFERLTPTVIVGSLGLVITATSFYRSTKRKRRTFPES